MRKINFGYCTLEEAVEQLIEHNVFGQHVYGEFNGHRLESDNISLDKAYKEVVGCTYGEFKEKQMRNHFEYEKREQEHEAAIPKLSEEWIIKGHEILDEKYWDEWDKIVPIRLKDLYHGMELGNCLDIVKSLNYNCDIEEAKKIIYDQDHSGMSFGLVRAMVATFCDRGEEFSNYVK